MSVSCHYKHGLITCKKSAITTTWKHDKNEKSEKTIEVANESINFGAKVVEDFLQKRLDDAMAESESKIIETS